MKQLGETLAIIAIGLFGMALFQPKALGEIAGTIVAAYHHAESGQ